MIKYSIALFFIMFFRMSIMGQSEQGLFSMERAIFLALENSLDSRINEHSLLSNEWTFKTFKAIHMPYLTMSASVPSYNRSISKQYVNDQFKFVEQNTLAPTVSVGLRQNLAFMNASLFIGSTLSRLDNLGANRTSNYNSSPIGFSFNQKISGYNPYKWEKMIAPKLHEMGKRKYSSEKEKISSLAVEFYFEILLSQKRLIITERALENTTYLLKITQKRYEIGSISESEFLEMELSYFKASNELKSLQLAYTDAVNAMSELIGVSIDKDNLDLIVPNKPHLTFVDVDSFIKKSLSHGNFDIEQEVQLINSDRSLKQAKSELGVNADLSLQFGLRNNASALTDAYTDNQVQQYVNLDLTIDILNWGQKRGAYMLSKSNNDILQLSAEQNRINYLNGLRKLANDYNQQAFLMKNIAKADTIAQKRFDIIEKNYIKGGVSTTDYNNALNDRNIASLGHISAILRYWKLYYEIRRISLYNFESNTPFEL